MSLIYNLVITGYVLLLVSVGLYFYITEDGEELTDYMLGGRNIGKWSMAVSDAASIQTAFVFLAFVGTGYTTGLFGLWYAIGDAFVYLFVYRFLGPKLRKQSERIGSQTISDHISTYYRDSKWSDPIRGVGLLIIIIFLTAYISAQIIAVGEVASTTMGINYDIGIIVGGLLVVTYVVLGGFNASIWTDFIQGIIAFSAAAVLPIVMINAIGGVGDFISQANSIDPTLFSATGGYVGLPFLLHVLVWYGLALSLIGQPHGLMRLQSIRSERDISAASIATVGLLALSMITPLIIGIAGRILYPNIADPEVVALVALQDFFPAIIAGVLAAGVLSIILSTTDSMMIVVSADATRFYQEIINPDASESTLISSGRIMVAVVTIISVVIAHFQLASIFTIISFAFVGLGVGLGVPLIAIIWWDGVTAQGVFAAMVVGILSTVINQIFLPDLFPILPWPATIATIVVVSKFGSIQFSNPTLAESD
jgi:sodium/proline symporter